MVNIQNTLLPLLEIKMPLQGGHILAKMKFPVFSLSFPCVLEIFPVLFLRKN